MPSSVHFRPLLPCCLLWFLTLSLPVSAQTGLTIRVGNFFPNYFLNDVGEWEGVDAELGQTLVERAGFEHQFISIPWLRALAMAEAGDVDILVNVNITAARSDYLHWIGPARETQVNLVVHRTYKHMVIESWDDFVRECQRLGKRFGYQSGVKYSDEFHRRLETDEDFHDCFEASAKPLSHDMALGGRILGYFDEVLNVKRESLRNPDYNLVLHPFVVSTEPVFFGVSKRSVSIPTLIRLYEAYESLVEDGTFEAIRTRWRE